MQSTRIFNIKLEQFRAQVLWGIPNRHVLDVVVRWERMLPSKIKHRIVIQHDTLNGKAIGGKESHEVFAMSVQCVDVKLRKWRLNLRKKVCISIGVQAQNLAFGKGSIPWNPMQLVAVTAVDIPSHIAVGTHP